MSKMFSPAADIPSLANKVILVTGGNNGLGKESISQLARHQPAKIWMGARSGEKAAAAIKDIQSQFIEKVDIEFLPIDLASLKSVRAAADIVNSRSSRLDILMLNAGIMAVPSGKTEDGFEIQIGTNHVGHFYLTNRLLPLLHKTAKEYGDARVVSVSSDAYNFAPSFDSLVSTEKLCQKGEWARYGASKAANILFAAELARRHPQLTSISVYPGVIMTDLHKPGQGTMVSTVMKMLTPFIAKSVSTGTLTQLWASTAVRTSLANGKYYASVAKRSDIKYVRDEEWGKQLWDWTEQELAAKGF
jgi:NAD(P)-dependent dehydrogenase (short-subunit alcohol dehydrogenase family)